MQMCQWIVALESFLNGSAADTLLESLVAITRAIADQAEQSQRRRRGRPCIAITEEQILFFAEHGFTTAAIAKLFGCSRRTVERRMQEFNITMRSRYSNISDLELGRIVASICLRNPNLGEKSIDGLFTQIRIPSLHHFSFLLSAPSCFQYSDNKS